MEIKKAVLDDLIKDYKKPEELPSPYPQILPQIFLLIQIQ
jgi:hypothetical protein